MQPRVIKGLSDIFGLYDAFILDLWGVVHDGVAPFADTIPALEALKKAKRKVWLLSNAPRRNGTVIDKLTKMGVTPDLYDGILTSGEVSREALKKNLLAKWGRSCIHIGPQRDTDIYEGLDVSIVRDPAAADFVLNSGVVNFSDPVESYLPLLKECARHKLPMLCANPDKIVHVENQSVICAGTLADMYAELGEMEIVYFGKPYRDVYSYCLEALGARRVLAVGDSMLTDIRGATAAGLDSVLVTSGIHRDELQGCELEDFFLKYPYQPGYVMKGFAW